MPQEFIAVAFLHLARFVARSQRSLPFIDLRRNLDHTFCGERRILTPSQQRLHPLRSEPPLRDEPVAGQSTLQWRRSDSILVQVIAAGNRTQPLNVEVGIFYFQRVKSPLD